MAIVCVRSLTLDYHGVLAVSVLAAVQQSASLIQAFSILSPGIAWVANVQLGIAFQARGALSISYMLHQ